MNGNRLKEARVRAGHTQESLSEVLGTNARQIWRWESNETKPSGDDVARLAQELSVSADYLLGISEDPNPGFKQGDLKPKERAVLSAWRRGDKVEAVRVIINDE